MKNILDVYCHKSIYDLVQNCVSKDMMVVNGIQTQFFLECLFFLMLNALCPFYLFIICLLIWYGTNAKKEVLQVFRKIFIGLIPKTKTEMLLKEATKHDGEDSQENSSVVFHEILKEQHSYHVAVGFLNKIITRIWNKCMIPHISKENIQKFLDTYCEVSKQKNGEWANFLENVEIDTVSIGHCPLTITKITARDHKDNLSLRIRLVYPGDGNFSVKWSHPDLLAGDVRNFGFACNMEINIGPFHRDFSLLRGFSFSLIDHPILTLEGGGFFNLPVETIMRVFKMTSGPILDYFMIHPRCVSVDLPNDGFHYPVISRAAGILKVFIVEARDLLKTDTTFNVTGFKKIDKKMSSSDPYCILRLDRNWVKSNQINRTLNPKFNFLCKFPLLASDFENELIIEIWDKNSLTDHINIGLTSLDLASFKNSDGEIHDLTMDVGSAAATGNIRLLTQVLPCSQNAESNEAVLVLLIRSVHNNHRIEPIVAAQISGHRMMTTVKGTFGQFHEFLEEIALVVDDIEKDLLRVCLYDASQKRKEDVFQRIKKGISYTQKALQTDFIKHKKFDIEDLNFTLLGDITFPVKHFITENVTRLILNPATEIESTLEVEINVHIVKKMETNLEDIVGTVAKEESSFLKSLESIKLK